MKFITKKQTARVIEGSNEGTLDLELLTPGTEVGGEIVPEEKVLEEEPLELDKNDEAQYNRLVSSLMNENRKFKAIAMHDAQLGAIVTVSLKYLVE